MTLPSLGRTPAEKCGHAAAGREPVQLRALIDLGELIQDKRPEESLALYGKGLSTAPTDVTLLGWPFDVARRLARWDDGSTESLARLADTEPAGEPHEPLPLLAQATHPATQANLCREAATRGIAKNRIVFAPWMALEPHVVHNQLADLMLDTHPDNSGATGSDAQRGGFPILCHVGNTMVGRMAASLMHHLGLPELVAPDRRRMVDLAVDLANDAGRIATLKARLKERLGPSSLFNPDGFARDLERLLMWWERESPVFEHSRAPGFTIMRYPVQKGRNDPASQDSPRQETP